LRAFDSSLSNFGGNFGGTPRESAPSDAAEKPLANGLCGFGNRAAKDASSTKGSDVSGAFERSLNGSGTSSSTGTDNVAGLLDLAFDVGAKELRERGSRATNDATCDTTAKTAPARRSCAS
jgi:hypothetical protein